VGFKIKYSSNGMMNSALRDEFRFASGGGQKNKVFARGARVLWYSNSPAMWRRSHAIGRATIRAAAALRKGKAEFDLFVIEGYDGPQT
jgi:hypothetical protein